MVGDAIEAEPAMGSLQAAAPGHCRFPLPHPSLHLECAPAGYTVAHERTGPQILSMYSLADHQAHEDPQEWSSLGASVA